MQRGIFFRISRVKEKSAISECIVFRTIVNCRKIIFASLLVLYYERLLLPDIPVINEREKYAYALHVGLGPFTRKFRFHINVTDTFMHLIILCLYLLNIYGAFNYL